VKIITISLLAARNLSLETRAKPSSLINLVQNYGSKIKENSNLSAFVPDEKVLNNARPKDKIVLAQFIFTSPYKKHCIIASR